MLRLLFLSRATANDIYMCHRSTCKITGELLYNDDFLIEIRTVINHEWNHWSDSEDTLRRYKDIDYTLEVQQPIAFLNCNQS